MEDRLVEVLKFFSLKAGVFHRGALCREVQFDQQPGVGFIHLLQQGVLRVESPSHPPLLTDEPSLILYMNPTQHHLIPNNEEVEIVCASFQFGLVMHNPIAQSLQQVTVIRLSEMRSLEMALTLLFKEAGEHHCGQQAVLDRLMEVVIIQVLRDFMDQRRLDIGLLAGLAEPRLSKAINAMHAQPERAWSLEELAAIAGMSRARFATHFREMVGSTPGAYLSEWRLGVAQSLLKKGKPVQLVSDLVGYSSASALSRAFRAQTGLSPKEWLKQVSP